MGKFFSAIFGGGGKKTVAPQPIQDTEDEKKKARKSRVRKIGTQGGISGQELQPGSVGGTDNIFGN